MGAPDAPGVLCAMPAGSAAPAYGMDAAQPHGLAAACAAHVPMPATGAQPAPRLPGAELQQQQLQQLQQQQSLGAAPPETLAEKGCQSDL